MLIQHINGIPHDLRGRRVYSIVCHLCRRRRYIPVHPYAGAMCSPCYQQVKKAGKSVIVVDSKGRTQRVIHVG